MTAAISHSSGGSHSLLTIARIRRLKEGTWVGVVSVADGQARPSGLLRCSELRDNEVTIVRRNGPSLTLYTHGDDNDRWTHSNSGTQYFLLRI